MGFSWQWELVQWLNGIATLFCLLILLMVWHNVQVIDLRFSTKKIGWYSVCGMLCFSISVICKTYQVITINNFENMSISNKIASAIYSLTWSWGQMFVYLLFIERLKYSFKNTKYESSPRYYYPFYIGIILFIIITITTQIISILYRENIIGIIAYDDSGNVRNVAEQIIDLFLSFGLLYVFIKKLSILNMDLCVFNNEEISNKSLNRSSISSISSISSQRSSISLNSRQESVIKISSKLTIISCFAIFSTQCLMIYSTTIFLLCGSINCSRLNDDYFRITDSFWGIDCFINCLCIYMSFGFMSSQNTYYAVCGCCDTQCIKCCRYISEKRVERRIKKQIKKIEKIEKPALKLSLLSADNTHL